MFAVESRFQKDLSSLFEGALPKRSTVDSVYSMTRDGSEYASLCHHINQCAQVTVVDVNVISAQNHAQLFYQTVASCLYA